MPFILGLSTWILLFYPKAKSSKAPSIKDRDKNLTASGLPQLEIQLE